jgi:hypothetical protein
MSLILKDPRPPSAGDLVLALGEDACWRVALVDSWRAERRTLLAAFDAVHPDGSLDFYPHRLGEGHRAQRLGRADRYFADRQELCQAVDALWTDGTADSILMAAPEVWRALPHGPIPALVRAKAVHRLEQACQGGPTTRELAEQALAGALQENIEIRDARLAGSDLEVGAKVDKALAAAKTGRKRASKAAPPSTWPDAF